MEHKPHKQHTEMEQEHFCPTGNQGAEPTSSPQLQAAEPLAATDTLPYRTAKSEEDGVNIRSKRIQTGKDVLHPLKTVAGFLDLSNGYYFFLYFSRQNQIDP